MEDLSIVNSAILPLAWFLIEAVKKLFGLDQPGWFKRLLPFLPFAFCFGLSFVPGLGVASLSIGARLLLALAAGGITNSGRDVMRKTLGKDQNAQ